VVGLPDGSGEVPEGDRSGVCDYEGLAVDAVGVPVLLFGGRGGSCAFPCWAVGRMRCRLCGCCFCVVVEVAANTTARLGGLMLCSGFEEVCGGEQVRVRDVAYVREVEEVNVVAELVFRAAGAQDVEHVRDHLDVVLAEHGGGAESGG